MPLSFSTTGASPRAVSGSWVRIFLIGSTCKRRQ
jgi:hypothetical protein